jgi:transcriptional regulator with XRE-family HTH domain
MDYGREDVGPALKRLREAAGIRQNRLAAKLRRSGANVSRIEREGSNPKLETVFRYLEAIGADFADLARELGEGDDPLDELVATVDRKIREHSDYREMARGMLERFGDPEPPPALRALAELIDRQGEELAEHGERLRRLEGESAAGDEPPGSAGGSADG